MSTENNGQKKTKRGGKRTGAGRKPGAPNKLPDDMRKEALSYSGDALQFYRNVLNDTGAPINWRFAAAEQLLDRVWNRDRLGVARAHEFGLTSSGSFARAHGLRDA